MKVMITGARGQLGSELYSYLSHAGAEVVAAPREELDIVDPAAALLWMSRHRPDWVVNCAAYTQVDRAEAEPARAFAVNRDGAGNLAKASQKFGARMLQLSTDYVFDGCRQTPYDESAPCHPVNVYGQSKRAGEEAVLGENPTAIVLRTSWLYGGHGNNFVSKILALARERDELRVVADQFGTPTWTRDITDVIFRLLSSETTGIVHYSACGFASWHEFACAVVEQARALGQTLRAKRIVPVLSHEYASAARRPAYSVLDKQKIATILKDLVIPGWRDSLNAMLEERYAC